MSSQWLAVGAETDPLRRARELQRSWERLLADGALGPDLPPGATAGLRPTIVESWRRSLATGLDPTNLLAPIEADESEVLGRWFEHPLGSLTHVLTEQLRKLAEESRGMVVVTDASGLVLQRVGDEWLKERAAEMNLVEGARYNEAADGTNGIGTALAADQAYQVFAFEHFNERHHQWVCSGAPVHDPVSGQTVGLIDLSTLWKNANPRSLELVTTAARTIEQHLVDARRDLDSRLRRRYSDFMTRSTDLLVDRDGYVLDGAELGHPSPFDIPEGGGEVVLADGSVAVAAPLGRGEAFLLRQGTTRHARSAPAAKGLERAEEHARELAIEQAALRQVATLVARESSPDQLFAVVAEQVARILHVPHVRLVLYEPEGSVVVGGFSESDHEPFPIGSRWPLDSPGVTATVRKTGRPARVEDYADMTGQIAAVVRDAGMHSAVASPIMVERRLWGAMVVLSPRDEPLPEDTEARLTDFTELVATAIANAESREALAQLAEEQAALRRVATVVAGGTGPDQLFAAVADGVQELFGAEISAILRFEDDGTVVTVGAHGGPNAAGSRAEPDPDFVVAAVRETRRAARFDTDDPAASDVPVIVRETGARSAVASPIVVEGKLWGAIVVGSLNRSLPPGTEQRLADFTELIATAVANTQAREQVRALADEQAALRRVAVLVAQQPSPSEVFTAVTQAVGLLLGADIAVLHVFPGDGMATMIAGWSGDGGIPPIGTQVPLDGDNLAARIFESGAPARIDSYAEAGEGQATDLARSFGLRSSVGAPILVEGKLWGALVAATRGVEPWAENAETRIAAFTELAATAIANAESREALAELADEQAALRRVATMVAQGASPQDLFAAVAEEVGRLLPVGSAAMGRYEPDDSVTTVASWSTTEAAFPTGVRWPTEGTNVAWIVLQTGRSARIDDFSAATDPIGVAAREAGMKSAVGSPIVVEGRLWGVMTATSTEGPLPPDTDARLASFTELVATAIADAESQGALEQLADEQAALRRVATLVARDASSTEVFEAVATEVGKLLDTDITVVGRYDDDRVATAIGSWSSSPGGVPVGTRSAIGGHNVLTIVAETGKPARVDGYDDATGEAAEIARRHGWRSSIAAPIVVESRVWGVMLVATKRPESFPAGAEVRLAAFTDLVATAVANAEAHDRVIRFGEEQATLRRIATLVAEGLRPAEIFAVVIEEVGRLFGTDLTIVGRFKDEPPAFVAVALGNGMHGLDVGTSWAFDDPLAAANVFQSGRSVRVNERLRERSAALAEVLARLGVVSTVSGPIMVEGRLWGAVMVSSLQELPAETEERVDKFTELIATAVANAEGRSELAASRRRIVAASDETRRQIERDLHDGTQQRLVSLGLAVRAAEANLPLDRDDLRVQLSGVAAGLVAAVEDLQEISRGIHPAILSKGGLGPSLRALAHRSAISVDLEITTDVRLAEPIEVAAYFVASEALANAAKHSQASRIDVSLEQRERSLLLSVSDDGVGGADPARGSGLVGLTDRVEALGGSIRVSSRPGEGTQVTVELPVELELPQPRG